MGAMEMEANVRRSHVVHRLRMEGLDVNREVRQYKDILSKRLMPCRVRRVVSPYEFYLELTSFPEPRLYRSWYPTMQDFYENSSNQEKMQLFRGTPLPGRCYVCKDFRDGKWHRVRLHSVRKPFSSLIVFYLDLCKLQVTKAENLLELAPEFAQPPAQVFRCYLSDLSPVDTLGDTEWSEEACAHFQATVENKELIGIALCRSDDRVTESMPDFITSMGVVLAESQPGTRSPKPEVCTVNAQMVDAGFAAATGVCAGCQHAFAIENFVPFFDRVELDTLYPSVPKRTVAFEVGESSSAAIPLPELDTEQNFMLPNGLNFDVAEVGNEAAYYKNTTDYLPVEISSQLAGIIVVYVVSPSHIIVQLKCQQANFKEMQEGMRRMVENNEPLVQGKVGMFVACNIIDFVEDKVEKTIWCRGLISKVLKKQMTETYKVLLVDYGTVVEVESFFVRQLPVYFEKIASFAIRVHLDVENLMPVVTVPETCSASAVASNFRKYLLEWVETEPIYFMCRPIHAEKFELRHYGQLVLYNVDEHKWCADEEKKTTLSPFHKLLNELREHPMVHSLLVSVGVELKYELFFRNNHFWYFKSISDILERQGHSQTYRKSKTGTRLHCDVVDAARSNQAEQEPAAAGLSAKLTPLK